MEIIDSFEIELIESMNIKHMNDPSKAYLALFEIEAVQLQTIVDSKREIVNVSTLIPCSKFLKELPQRLKSDFVIGTLLDLSSNLLDVFIHTDFFEEFSPVFTRHHEQLF